MLSVGVHGPFLLIRGMVTVAGIESVASATREETPREMREMRLATWGRGHCTGEACLSKVLGPEQGVSMSKEEGAFGLGQPAQM